ncbi:MAG: MotA/TolQ/ExbB proton channel family protein [Magnetococcales bacterium]|nr:MotA/TolQ/ExbB proton channel family protein [Magnetococcales bacterium]MBF0157590.1 MotA/TolQ/ExbB proton channel family protein [Magnetococcales bacterium]
MKLDISTVIGLVMGALIVLGLMGHNITLFWSSHAMIVVVGGLIASTFIKFNITDVMSTGAILSKLFKVPTEHPQDIIATVSDCANIARKDGILALEKVKTPNHFLQSAINYCVDGVDPKFLRDALTKEMEYMQTRHHVGVVMFESMGEAGPAMGMVGTLIGMVELLSNLDDPSSIGPSMATALLATMYGAIVANIIVIPFGIKLHHYSTHECINYQIIIEGIAGIQSGLNPRILEQSLFVALSRKQREMLH